jgi:hypothetical protein
MRRRALIVAVVVVALALGTIGPATADTPGCVTRREFRQVHRGIRRVMAVNLAVNPTFHRANQR